MPPHKITVAILLATAACTSAAPPPAPAPAPSEPAAKPVEAKGPVVLAAGELLAPVAGGSRNQQTWHVPGGPIELATIQRGDQVVLRAFTANGAFDVTAPNKVGLDNAVVVVDDGTAVLLQQRSHLRPSPSTPDTMLSRYTVTRINWDESASKPILGETWSCDETDDDPCLPPSWADDNNPVGPARRPANDEAIVAVQEWLAAIDKLDVAAVEAAMARGFRLGVSSGTSSFDACTAFGTVVETKGTGQRTDAAACMIDALDSGGAKKLAKRVTAKSVTSGPSYELEGGPNDAYVTITASDGTYAEWTLVATVTYVELETRITGALVSAEFYDQ